jgi:hypothetical protein
MKHVGKMKNNSARVAVAYRTLPGDPTSALVVGVHGLGDSYHDYLMNVIESDSGQQANELADIIAARRFADGSNMLEYLHVNGHLKKVPTNTVLMTPDNQTLMPLDQLNELIAQQKGVSIEDLAVTDGSQKSAKKPNVKAKATVVTEDEPTTAADMRSKADKLFKEAQALRKAADQMDPPKSKTKKITETIE